MQISPLGTPPRTPVAPPSTVPVAGPVDRVIEAAAPPPALTMAQVRRIVANAEPVPQRRVEIDTLPFGIEIELEGFRRADAPRLVKDLPAWNVKPDLASWTITEDASVPGMKQGTGGEAISPPMILRGGEAERQIRTVLDGLREMGGRPTNACGLHIHVDASKLGPKGLANLMKMAVEQEHALFKLSQNGQAQHRGAVGQRPFHYCKPIAAALRDPFSVLHAESADEFRNALYGQIAADPNYPRPRLPAVGADQPFRPNRRDSARYFDVNFNSFWYRGTIEFRIFNATDDAQKVLDDVALALGMVAGAANDDYTWLQANPLQTKAPNAPVSREAFDHFLSRTVADPATRERLTQTFAAGGGVFAEDAPVAPEIAQIARLIDRGHRFVIDGKPVVSPFDIASAGQKPAPVAGKTPVKQREITVDGAPLGSLDALSAQLDADVKAAFTQVSAQGVRFEDASGATLSSWNGEAALTMVRADGARIALSADDAEPMLLAVSGRWDRLPRAVQDRRPAVERIVAGGATFQDGEAILSPAEACVLAGTAGRIRAAVGPDRVTLGTALSLDDLRAACGEGRPRPALERALSHISVLQSRGNDFGMQWRPAIAAALLEGREVNVSGVGPVHSVAELEPAVVAARRQVLAAPQQAQYDTLMQLQAAHGFAYSTALDEAPAAGSVEQLQLLSANEALAVTVPGLGTKIPLQNAGQAAALAAATATLPAGLGALLGRHIVPALMLDVDRGITENEAARQLAGRLTVTPAGGVPTTYEVAPVADAPAVDIRGPQGAVRVALTDAVDGAPRVTVDGTPMDPRLLRDAEAGTRHAVAPGAELWTAAGTRAIFEPTASGLRAGGDIARLGLFPRRHFEVCASEESKIEGYRTTNEVSTWFPEFTLQGGAYLGVGAAQNYDHLTRIKAEMVFLVDADPRVAQDHRAILAIVGQSRNPAHFLSMLMGTRLTPAEESLPMPRVLDLIKTRGADAAFVEETKAALAGHLSEEQMQAVNAVMGDARKVFLPAWTTQVVKEKQNLWLTDGERFSHLRFLQNAGRITVRCASVTGPAVMGSIAEQVALWNRTHFPPLTFNAVYLSNAEQWIAKGNRQQAAYPRLIEHLSQLPLHPEGVILRTGGTDVGGVNKGQSSNCNWNFSSLPMQRYLVAARQKGDYAAINKACLPHLKEQQAVQAERLDSYVDHLARRLAASGAAVEGTRTVAALGKGELRVGEVVPHTVQSLRALAEAGGAMPAELAAVRQALGAGAVVVDPKTKKPMSDAASIWEALQERPLELRRDKQSWTVASAADLACAALIESGQIAALPAQARAEVEGLIALRDAGWGMASSTAKGTSSSLTTLMTWLNTGVLTLKSPMGDSVSLTSAAELMATLPALRLQAADETAQMAALRASVEAIAQPQGGPQAVVPGAAAAGQSLAIGSKGADDTLEMKWLRANVCKNGTLSVNTLAELGTAARMARGEVAGLSDAERSITENFTRLGALGWRLEAAGPLPNAGAAWLNGLRRTALKLVSPMGEATPVNGVVALTAALEAAAGRAPQVQARMASLQADLGTLPGVRCAVPVAGSSADAVRAGGKGSSAGAVRAGATEASAGAVRAGATEASAGAVAAASAAAVELRWLASQTAAIAATAVTVQSPDELEAAAAMQRRQTASAAQATFVAQFDALGAQGWTFGAAPGAVSAEGNAAGVRAGAAAKGAAAAAAGAARIEVTTPGVAWLAAQRGQLVATRGGFTSMLVDNMRGWPALRAVIGDREGLSDEQRERLSATETLLAKGATVTVGDVAVERAEETLLASTSPVFHLPRRVWWGLLPRKHITVRSTADLTKLATRAR